MTVIATTPTPCTPPEMVPELFNVMLLPFIPTAVGFAAEMPPKIPPKLSTVPVCKITPTAVPVTEALFWTVMVFPVLAFVP